MIKRSINSKTREQKKKASDDIKDYNELMKKAQIENKMKDREISLEEVKEKKQ